MTAKDGTMWSGTWRGLDLSVERRSVGEDRGATLRVGAPSGGSSQPNPEWLRFDCLERNPHWHKDPKGQDEIRPLDPREDVVTRVFEILEQETEALVARIDSHAPPAAATNEDAIVLRDAQRAMRHRPAVLDELDPVVLRERRSQKWHTYPPDILPAWVAEMDFPVASPIQDELRRFVESADVGYPIGLADSGLPEVFCERMSECFDWEPEPSRVEVLSEVVQGIYLAVEAFSEPGEGIVVQTPIYPPFLDAVHDTNRRLVENRMQIREDRLEFDLESLETAVADDCRMILFCNPHNPSGRVCTRAELERVAALAVEHDLVVVSDEIHADLILDDRRHVPLATLGPEIARRTVTLTSVSKAFNIPGLRTAIAHFGDPEVQRRFNSVVPRHARGGLGLFGLYASIAAWRWAQPWLDEVVPHLRANRDFVQATLAERIPEIRFLRPEATYLAWLDCRDLALEGPPAAHFMRHGKVAISEGRLFGPGWEGFVRLNFATSRPILAEVIDRMAKAVGR